MQAEHACPLGAAWFGDGRVPGVVRVDGRDCGVDQALDAAAALLRGARGRLFVFLGDELTCAAQRLALGLADRLRAVADGVVSETAAGGILAAQRRGRATATLGEIRNRADLVLYWAIDPDQRYPRYRSRYAGYPSGLHLRRGPRCRTVISVSVGADAGPAEADLRLTLRPEQELGALAELRAHLAGRTLGEAGGPAAEVAELVGPAHQRQVRGHRTRWRILARAALARPDGGAHRPGAGAQRTDPRGAEHPARRRQPERRRGGHDLADRLPLCGRLHPRVPALSAGPPGRRPLRPSVLRGRPRGRARRRASRRPCAAACPTSRRGGGTAGERSAVSGTSRHRHRHRGHSRGGARVPHGRSSATASGRRTGAPAPLNDLERLAYRLVEAGR